MDNILLEKIFSQRSSAIEAWFAEQFAQAPPVPFCSTDLRYANYKITPVDTNLFPAGFNNLHHHHIAIANIAAKNMMENIAPNIKKILLVPENHTRHLLYFENVATLQQIFMAAGFEIRIGSLLTEITSSQEIILSNQQKIILEPIIVNKQAISVNYFEPDIILLNNDLSEGIPTILQDILQPIMPLPTLGWSTRFKSQHFQHYNNVANMLAELLTIDSWLINAYFDVGENIDFTNHHGEDLLVEKSAALLARIQQKYNQYHITQQPFLMIKADNGSYGMGVISINNIDQLKQLNHKQRTKMHMTKGNRVINRVLIQEGVYTSERYGVNSLTAEPVIYIIGQQVIGGFYRMHNTKSDQDNLNSPGMSFAAIEEDFANPQQQKYYFYSVIARLALLAASYEMKELMHG